MRRDEKVLILRKIFGKEAFSKKDELIFFCKFPSGCSGNHHKPKLSVNVSTDNFHCWVCGWKGKSLAPIFKIFDKVSLERYFDGKNISKKEKIDEFDVPVLPESFTFLRNKSDSLYYRQAINYLKSRSITESDIYRYKLGYCYSGEYKNRIIIPSFDDNGDLNFFVGRSFVESNQPYKHGKFSKDIIFNDYMIDWDKPVILTEGPFDAMIAGDNAIPLQGCEIGDGSSLVKKIVMNCDSVYIALDSDAKKKQRELLELFLSYGVCVYNIDVSSIKKKDVGCMSREEFATLKKSAFKVSNDLDYLRMKVSA